MMLWLLLCSCGTAMAEVQQRCACWMRRRGWRGRHPTVWLPTLMKLAKNCSPLRWGAEVGKHVGLNCVLLIHGPSDVVVHPPLPSTTGQCNGCIEGPSQVQEAAKATARAQGQADPKHVRERRYNNYEWLSVVCTSPVAWPLTVSFAYTFAACLVGWLVGWSDGLLKSSLRIATDLPGGEGPEMEYVHQALPVHNPSLLLTPSLLLLCLQISCGRHADTRVGPTEAAHIKHHLLREGQGCLPRPPEAQLPWPRLHTCARLEHRQAAAHQQHSEHGRPLPSSEARQAAAEFKQERSCAWGCRIRPCGSVAGAGWRFFLLLLLLLGRVAADGAGLLKPTTGPDATPRAAGGG